MTIDDLERAMGEAIESFVAFNDTLTKPYSPETIVRYSNLAGAASFAKNVWKIACDYGVPAAMLFKLSDGHIDPRPPAS